MIHIAKFSNDARYALTTSEDHTAIIWNVKTGTVYKVLRHDRAVNDAVFTDDGLFVATAQDTGKLSLWEVANGKLIQESLCDSADVIHIAAQPGGHLIAAATAKGTLAFWSPLNQNQLRVISAHNLRVTALAFDKSGHNILTASFDNTVKLWDVKSGEPMNSFVGDNNAIRSAAFSADDRLIIASTNYESAIVWKRTDSMAFHTFKSHVALINHTHLSPNGKALITSSNDGTIKTWNLETGKIAHAYYTNSHAVRDADFAKDGSNISCAVHEGVQIWDSLFNKKEYAKPNNVGGIWDADYSKNGEELVAIAYLSENQRSFKDNYILTWNFRTRQWSPAVRVRSDLQTFAHLSADGTRIVSSDTGSSCKIWDAQTGVLLDSLHEMDWVTDARFSDDGHFLITTLGNVWDLKTKKVVRALEGPIKFGEFYAAKFNRDGHKALLYSSSGIAKLWNIDNGKLLHIYSNESGMVVSANFTLDEKELLITYINSTTTAWDVESEQQLYSFLSIDSSREITFGNDRYYMCDRNAGKRLYYIKGAQTIGFDQLDVKYNRPDKVLQAIGIAVGHSDTSRISSYYLAYQKRIRKLGIDTSSFKEGFSVPECGFKNQEAIAYEQTNDKLNLTILGVDSIYKLDRFNVWINDVPLYGLRGINIRRDSLNKIEKSITINLSEGKNRIETSVTNVNGTESYRSGLDVKYTPEQPIKGKLWFVGIGINHYKNGHDLKWSVKDIGDLADSLRHIYGDAMETYTLFDSAVSIKNVKALKEKLRKSGVNDKVIVAFSGHGLLSSNYDYYLATFDVNFEKPEEGGLPYDDLEWLIDSIPARKKLMLIDACHSGEVDKDEYVAMTKLANSLGISSKGFDPPKSGKTKAKLGLNNSLALMQDLFANVSRGTGATVISAAAGNQYAIEKNDLKNGIFTYTILDLMRQKKEVSVDELKNSVINRVTQLTGGLQKPTCRNETQDNNWRVW